VCVSVQRVYVHSSICEEVTARLVEDAHKLKVGDPLNPTTEIGPLISHHEVDRVDSWVQEAIAGGATLLCGGKRESASCYQPTVLLNPKSEAKVSQLEVFGPVICIYSYDELDHALAAANSLDVSFQAAVFTKDIDKALYVVKRLNAMTVMVNDHTAFRVDWMPFGGAKMSGLGMGGIPYSMEEMSKDKLFIIKSNAI